jgi:hypothetical protein
VEFVLPTATMTASPATDTPKPTEIPASLPAALPTQAVEPAPAAQTSMGTYLLYTSILLVLGALIIYLIRSHNR